MTENKKKSTVFSKQDSASFKAYEDLVNIHGDSVSTRMPKGFIDKYKEFSKPLDVKVEKTDYSKIDSTSPGYASTRKKELSNFIMDTSKRQRKLQSKFDKDFEIFEKDKARYEDINSSIDTLQEEWNATEEGVWTFDSMFNTYKKDSSMGILKESLSKLRDERGTLKQSLFGGGRGFDRGREETINNRRKSLSRMSEELAKKTQKFNEIQDFELNQSGYKK